MAKASEHGRIIASAAKAALAPLGCLRRGQSRIWQDDHRYWAINVEFQPSGWSKGSYLNIHVAWLWAITHGYQYSYRAGSFIPFETAEQFTPLIAELAATAAVEVQRVRERDSDRLMTFSTIYKSAPRVSQTSGIISMPLSSTLSSATPQLHANTSSRLQYGMRQEVSGGLRQKKTH